MVHGLMFYLYMCCVVFFFLIVDVFYNQLLEYSLSEEQLTSNGYPRPTDEVGVASLKTESSTRSQIEPVGENGEEREREREKERERERGGVRKDNQADWDYP